MNHNHRLGRNYYFWRTYSQQEIDLLEIDGEKMIAMEMKSGRKSPKAPLAFSREYPDANYMVVNPDSFLGVCQLTTF